MTIKDAAQTIQAFPIHAGTQVIDSPSAFDVTRYNILHVNTDGNISFDFGTNVVSIDVVTGQDFAIKCVNITADCQVIVS